MEVKHIGIGLFDVLGIVFIILKLVGVIQWSWVWVLAPLWIQFAIIGVIAFIIGVLTIIVHLLEKAENNEN